MNRGPGRPPGKKAPLTDLERQKGHNIREQDPKSKGKPTRELKSSDLWEERNTRGNPKKRK